MIEPIQAAIAAGYSWQDIVSHHTQNDLPVPLRPSLGDIYGGQLQRGLASQGQEEQAILAAPRDIPPVASNDKVETAIVPGSGDRDTRGEKAPWEDTEEGGNVAAGTSMYEHNNPGSMQSKQQDI